MRIISLIKAASICLLFLISAPAFAASPEQTVETASQKLITALSKDKANLQANPKKLYAFVESMIVPYFDFDTMSQWVMGRSWQSANQQQRARFIKEFKILLINSYAGTLLEYSDEKIKVYPLSSAAKSGDEVVVKSEIISSKRAPAVINYSMIKSGSKWLVYDVSVEGVSIVTSYRSEIRELVNSKGVDGMIDTLATKNKQ